MSEQRDIPFGTPGFPHTLNNEDLLAYIRYTSSDKAAADTLRQRWESFWTKDYQKLKEFRFQIDKLILDQTAERQSNFNTRREIGELREKLKAYEEGRKIKALRATVRKLEKENKKLTEARDRLKKARPVPIEMAAVEHDLRNQIKRLQEKVTQMGWTIMELQQFNAASVFRIVPAVAVFDHPKMPATSTEVARMVRIVHDRLL